jgi:allophanate hydrolase subunit 2
VVREGVGGLQGRSLNKGDILAFHSHPMRPALQMPPRWQPDYDLQVPLHVVLGYQVNHFSAVAQAHFFSSVYTVSERMDRMGYRLTGPACRSNMTSMLSEGICHGAIQIPPDGQPIVLLNDRQTIGGYPKLGSMMARDTAKLAQLTQGCEVQFTRVTIEEAHAINAMDRYRSQAIRLLLI